MEAEYDITEWKFDLVEIFSFNLGKKFHFGSQGTTPEDDDGVKEKMFGEPTVDANTDAKEEVGAEYQPKPAPAKKQDFPDLPDSMSIGDEAS